MSKIRFRASKGGDFQLPPEGTFDLQIVEVKESTTKAGDPQIVVQFEIAAGEHSGTKFRQYYALTEERAWAFRALCEHAGLPMEGQDEDGNTAEFEADLEDLLERYIRATVHLNKSSDGARTFVNLRDEQPSKLGGQEDEAEDDEEAAPAEEAAQVSAAPPRRRRSVGA